MLEIILFGLIVIPFVAFGAFYSTYNKIIALDQRCEQAFHDIDIQLRHRHELIPNLIASVQGFVDHEDSILKAVIAARMHALGALSAEAQMEAEARLGGNIGQLLNLVDGYPELKASQHFKDLRLELSDCENKIAAARRFHNLTISEYNTVLSQYPGRKVGPMFRLHLRKFLDMSFERVYFEDVPVVKF